MGDEIMTVEYLDYDGPRRRWGSRPRRHTRFDDAVAEPVEVQDPIVSPPSTAAEPPWFETIDRRLAELGKLGRDWDGRGSATVSRDAVEFVRSMLNVAMAPTTIPPTIVPLGHGGVQLVWVSATTEIEVEVVKPYDIDIYQLDRVTGQDREWHAETEFSELARLLRLRFTR
jgi:hypothetical protein